MVGVLTDELLVLCGHGVAAQGLDFAAAAFEL